MIQPPQDRCVDQAHDGSDVAVRSVGVVPVGRKVTGARACQFGGERTAAARRFLGATPVVPVYEEPIQVGMFVGPHYVLTHGCADHV